MPLKTNFLGFCAALAIDPRIGKCSKNVDDDLTFSDFYS